MPSNRMDARKMEGWLIIRGTDWKCNQGYPQRQVGSGFHLDRVNFWKLIQHMGWDEGKRVLKLSSR
jgi:hypothetical protein